MIAEQLSGVPSHPCPRSASCLYTELEDRVANVTDATCGLIHNEQLREMLAALWHLGGMWSELREDWS